MGATPNYDYDRECPRCGGETVVENDGTPGGNTRRRCKSCSWVVHKSASSRSGPSVSERLDELRQRVRELEKQLEADHE